MKAQIIYIYLIKNKTKLFFSTFILTAWPGGTVVAYATVRVSVSDTIPGSDQMFVEPVNLLLRNLDVFF